MTRSLFYGWVVVAGCFVALMATSGVQNTFGLFFKPLTGEMGWDRSSLSMSMSLNLILYGISQPIMGQLADRFGARKVMLTSLIIIGIAVTLLGTATDVWQVHLYYGIIAALGFSGVAPVTISAVVTRWFVRRRGLALSIATTGMAAGQIVIIPLSMYLILLFGWRVTTLWLAGIASLLILPVVALTIKASPAEVGAQPDGDQGLVAAEKRSGPQQPAPVERPVPLKFALRQRAFWQLSVGFFFCGFSWSLILTHLVPFALDAGISEMLTANALSFMSIISVVCSIAMGALSDRYGRNVLLGLVYFVRALSFIMLPWVSTVSLLYLFAAIHGSGRLASVPMTSAMTGDQFGRASVGTVFGTILLAHQLGAALGSYSGGYFFDTTGSYFGAFILASVLGFVASAASFSIDPLRRPVDKLAFPAAR